MKNLLFSLLLLIAAIIAIGLAVSTETADRAANVAAASADQQSHSPPTATDDSVDLTMIREAEAPRTLTSSGRHILNAQYRVRDVTAERDGFAVVQIKPKIIGSRIFTTSLTNGFSGLGNDHYARADV